jgi:hypothetical protein
MSLVCGVRIIKRQKHSKSLDYLEGHEIYNQGEVRRVVSSFLKNKFVLF